MHLHAVMLLAGISLLLFVLGLFRRSAVLLSIAIAASMLSLVGAARVEVPVAVNATTGQVIVWSYSDHALMALAAIILLAAMVILIYVFTHGGEEW